VFAQIQLLGGMAIDVAVDEMIRDTPINKHTVVLVRLLARAKPRLQLTSMKSPGTVDPAGPCRAWTHGCLSRGLGWWTATYANRWDLTFEWDPLGTITPHARALASGDRAGRHGGRFHSARPVAVRRRFGPGLTASKS
jgi:hypothetical protein